VTHGSGEPHHHSGKRPDPEIPANHCGEADSQAAFRLATAGASVFSKKHAFYEGCARVSPAQGLLRRLLS